jgi:prepilin-type N-terminal cleavage/methylation domain-containing protein
MAWRAMMISEIGRNKRGFTLVEIMVSIAILSMGLVFILQSFIHSLHILNIAKNNLQAVSLAEENMVKFKMGSSRDANLYFGNTNGDTVFNNINFTWQVKLSHVGESEDLHEISSLVSWKQGRSRGAASLVSFLRTQPDEYI